MSQLAVTAKGKIDITSKEAFENSSSVCKVVVEVRRREPKFTFEGPWSGADIRTVTNTLRRAYHLYKMQLIKATEEKPSEEPKKESK